MSTLGRVPRHSLDAERFVLLAAMLDGTAAIGACEGIVTPDDFYSGANRIIWECALAVSRRGHGVDENTIRQELVRTNQLAAIGGDEYFLALQEGATAVDVETFAKIVRDAAQHRALTSICMAQASRGYDANVETSTFLQETEAAVFAHVRDSIAGGEIETAHQGLTAFWGHIQKVKAAGGILGVSTGIPSLDLAIDGLWDEDLIIIGGRPSMGKTALGETLLLNVSKALARLARDEVALMVSAEMGHVVLWPRLIAKESRVDSRKIRKNALDPNEVARVVASVKRIERLPLRIDTTSGITIEQIRSKARKLATRAKIRMVIVDYLQLIGTAQKYERRDLEVGDVARGLKALAKELHCPVVALAQVTRGSVNRPDRRPGMSDIAESGKIEQHADTILLIHREAYYRQEAIRNGRPDPGSGDMLDPDAAEIIVAKARSGVTGTVHLKYFGEFCEFADINAERHPPDGM